MRVEKAIRMRLRSNFDATLPRFDVMAALERADQGLTMSELSAHLLVSNGNVTGLVQRLVQDGLVERRVSPKDRRVQRVALTAEGRSTFATMAEGHEQWIESMFSGLTEDDVEQLNELLTKLRHSIEEAADDIR
jgi:DNA-binding MarR family transcriptional regulator